MPNRKKSFPFLQAANRNGNRFQCRRNGTFLNPGLCQFPVQTLCQIRQATLSAPLLPTLVSSSSFFPLFFLFYLHKNGIFYPIKLIFKENILIALETDVPGTSGKKKKRKKNRKKEGRKRKKERTHLSVAREDQVLFGDLSQCFWPRSQNILSES